ncbi:DNA-binding response regulator [Bifidobacterium sp. UTBIF-78]|uniref:DNA-binding response regulator n=1 Tax=Bifidobacterium sp. UTBIF-78 TaxID=1465263 RepID=UPI0021591338|nr:DNA-binding response regulator [Bifidobacterium sp. UTBIF-78]TPF94849.1 transcriptional regulator [Bifidobacterium sp. UTBIF-78]
MKLLVAASNEPLARAIRGTLLGAHHEADQVGTADAVLEALNEDSYNGVVLDEDLVDSPANALITSIRDVQPSVKILLLSSTPLSKATGAGNRWRALPDEYEPIKPTGYVDETGAAAASQRNEDGTAMFTGAVDASAPAGVSTATAALTTPSSTSSNAAALPASGEEINPVKSSATSGMMPGNQPDAVLRKPFSDTELLSYMAMLSVGSPTMIIRGNLTLDTTNRKAYYASTHSPVTLSRLEYSLLEALVKANGEFVNTRELVKLVGGPFFEQQGLLRNALYTLDKKLTKAGLIMTQRGSNWRIR